MCYNSFRKKIKKLNIIVFEKKIKKPGILFSKVCYNSIRKIKKGIDNMRNYVESNFSVNQLKGILKELNKQLGILEAITEYDSNTYTDVRNKMIDIHHYNSILYKMVEWKEFNEIQEELDEIRIQARETQK